MNGRGSLGRRAPFAERPSPAGCHTQRPTVNVSAPGSMTNAAKGDTSCELQRHQTHQNFECKLHLGRRPPGMYRLSVGPSYPPTLGWAAVTWDTHGRVRLSCVPKLSVPSPCLGAVEGPSTRGVTRPGHARGCPAGETPPGKFRGTFWPRVFTFRGRPLGSTWDANPPSRPQRCRRTGLT